ncbi:UNVERIFIED_CONTAM: hypothetical protein GTU68_043976 [Idotea baltica]|nr:hypothetical protein [Idotea baltica]
MHFASKTLVGESVENPCLYFRENVFNALNLIEECVKNNVNKFILSSTANLFDEPEVIPIKYNEKIVPGSPYGESKFMIERFLYWMDKIYDFKFTALRYFNACGASESRGEDHDPETHLIPLVLEVALGKREKISIFGDDYDTPDGTCVRDYIHILDLADAHILALKALDTNPSATYNLGNGKGFSVMEVIKTSEKITGEKINFDITDRRSGDPATLIADSNKIKEDLNWKPKYDSLESIIQTAWDWHRNNPKGYQK